MDIGNLLSLVTVLLLAIEVSILIWLIRFQRDIGGRGPGTRLLSIIVRTIALLTAAQLFDVLRDVRLDAADLTDFRIGQIILGIGDMAFTMLAILWAAWEINRLPVDAHGQSALRQRPQLSEGVREEIDYVPFTACTPIDQGDAQTIDRTNDHGSTSPVGSESRP